MLGANLERGPAVLEAMSFPDILYFMFFIRNTPVRSIVPIFRRKGHQYVGYYATRPLIEFGNKYAVPRIEYYVYMERMKEAGIVIPKGGTKPTLTDWIWTT
jgi:hypothetical protein